MIWEGSLSYLQGKRGCGLYLVWKGSFSYLIVSVYGVCPVCIRNHSTGPEEKSRALFEVRTHSSGAQQLTVRHVDILRSRWQHNIPTRCVAHVAPCSTLWPCHGAMCHSRGAEVTRVTEVAHPVQGECKPAARLASRLELWVAPQPVPPTDEHVACATLGEQRQDVARRVRHVPEWPVTPDVNQLAVWCRVGSADPKVVCPRRVHFPMWREE